MGIWHAIMAAAFFAACSQAQPAAKSGSMFGDQRLGGPITSASSGINTAWYINGELCGNSNPIGYKDPATGVSNSVWAIL